MISDDSLQRSGLQWYREDDFSDVPAYCSRPITTEAGTVHPIQMMECLFAVTGKKASGIIRASDISRIMAYLTGHGYTQSEAIAATRPIAKYKGKTIKAYIVGPYKRTPKATPRRKPSGNASGPRRSGSGTWSNIPKSCGIAPVRNPDGSHSIALLSRECVQAVTGRQSGALTQADRKKLDEYAQSLWRANSTNYYNFEDALRMVPVGTQIGSLTRGVWRGTFKSGVDKISDGFDTAVDAAKFALDPMNAVAVGALVIGLGMVGIGALRLLR